MTEHSSESVPLVESAGSAVSEVSAAFADIRAELDDHLLSINDSTNEIQANFEYLCKLESKVDKLAERMDQLQLFMQKFCGYQSEEKPTFDIAPLRTNEKDVFMILYTLDELDKQCTIKEISRRSGFSESSVSSYIASMIQKGVPIIKRYANGRAEFSLNKVFKMAQAKENLLKIEQQTLLKSFN